MTDRNMFRGAGVARITPFKDEGSIDESTLQRLVERQIEGGTDFLVPCGTTGENPTLTKEEHLRVVELTIKAAEGRVPILAGAGSNSTRRAIEFALGCLDLGAAGILTITPYYNKPTPDGLLRHFSGQAAAVERVSSGFPMIVYNVPGRTGCNITPETLRRLATEIPNIIGIKEASANLDQIARMLCEREEPFLVLSGDDSWTVPIISLGADGVISVIANETPALMKELVSCALEGDFEGARAIHNRLLPLMTANFIESNPAPAKAVLKMLGVIPTDFLRAPLAPVTDASRDRLQEVLAECNLTVH